jgi:hypothetical protein
MRKPPAAIALGPVIAAVLCLAGCGSTAAPGSDTAGNTPASGQPGAPGVSQPAASQPAASQSAARQPAASPPASSEPADGQPAASSCQASTIKISLDTGAAGAAAGSSYLPLEFRNSSARACTLPGYPLVSFASGLTGPVIGSPAVLEQQSSAQPLVLAPGRQAHAWLQIGDAANYPASSCKPETARGLRVVFGNGSASFFISRQFPVCAAAVHGTSLLAVYPVKAGQAGRGTAP